MPCPSRWAEGTRRPPLSIHPGGAGVAPGRVLPATYLGRRDGAGRVLAAAALITPLSEGILGVAAPRAVASALR